MPAPAWPLVTERLLLRPFESTDQEGLHDIYGDESVARWLYTDARTPEETRDF